MKNIDRIKMYTDVREHAHPIHEKYRFFFQFNSFSDTSSSCFYTVESGVKRAYFIVNFETKVIKCIDKANFKKKEIQEIIDILSNWLNAEIEC